MRVAEVFQRAGAAFGVSLVSDDQHYISRIDMARALNRVHAEIVRARPAHPLLVFYFAGHGISEGIGWNHFSIPGDFASRKQISDLGIDDLTGSTFHTADLVDTLESFKIPFLVLLDTCSEGKEQDFRNSVLSGVAQQNLREVAGVLRVINEFRESYPVLFSAEPGKVAITAADPRDPEYSSLGPLARRLTLIFDQVNKALTPLSLEALLSDMTSTTLDSKTKPAISHTEKRAFPELIFDPAERPLGTLEHLTATATQANICCGKTPVESGTPHYATGILQIEGKDGEFITGGQRYRFTSPPATFVITTQDSGRLALEIDEVPGSPWSMSFDAGKSGRFDARSYPNAERFDFGEKGRPGLDVSGNGHGCNNVEGSFTVSSAEYERDSVLKKLRLTFTQVCDDVKAPLTGLLDITIGK